MRTAFSDARATLQVVRRDEGVVDRLVQTRPRPRSRAGARTNAIALGRALARKARCAAARSAACRSRRGALSSSIRSTSRVMSGRCVGTETSKPLGASAQRRSRCARSSCGDALGALERLSEQRRDARAAQRDAAAARSAARSHRAPEPRAVPPPSSAISARACAQARARTSRRDRRRARSDDWTPCAGRCACWCGAPSADRSTRTRSARAACRLLISEFSPPITPASATGPSPSQISRSSPLSSRSTPSSVRMRSPARARRTSMREPRTRS